MCTLLALYWFELATLVLFLGLLAYFTFVWFNWFNCFCCFCLLSRALLACFGLLCLLDLICLLDLLYYAKINDTRLCRFHLAWLGLSPLGLV